MKIYYILFFILVAISLFFTLYFLIKSKNFLKLLFLNIILGAATLIILKLISKFTGVNIWINQYTMSASLIFGIPAVIGFIIFNFVFL